MIDRQAWHRRLDQALGHMEDRAYQARSWSGIGPEASSMEKVIFDVFEDGMLMDFVFFFRGRHSNLATQLKDAVEQAEALGLARRPPEDVLDHPAWAAVRKLAAELRRGLASRPPAVR